MGSVLGGPMRKAEEKDIVVSILALTQLRGYPPTIRELAEANGLKSAGSMLMRLRSMRDRGLVSYEDGNPRTLLLTRRGIEKCLPTH